MSSNWLKKALLTLTSVFVLATSSYANVNADKPKYPVYPDMKPAEHFTSNVQKNIESVIGSCKTTDVNEIDQSILINIPAYELIVENKLGEETCSKFYFPIRVGRHWEKHTSGPESKKMETPTGTGYVKNKNFQVKFTYFDNVYRTKYVPYYVEENGKQVKKWKAVKYLAHHKGDTIKESYTFDPLGNEIVIKMAGKGNAYDWIRSLGMVIQPSWGGNEMEGCIIHATTDAFTIGTPTSHCCVGLPMIGDDINFKDTESMLALYGLIAPNRKEGDLKKKVPITLIYDLVEIKDGQLVLHADVYNTKADYNSLIKEELKNFGCLDEEISEDKISELVGIATEQFKCYQKIRENLKAEKFMTNAEKDKLHYRIPLEDLISY